MDQDGSVKALTPELRARVLQYVSKMASQGLRTLTMAYRDLDADAAWPGGCGSASGGGGVGLAAGGAEGDELSELEREMTLVAAVGIKDPVRKEVPDAVRRCQRAGITVRMLTGGDHGCECCGR
jgi:Ca2+-transporting ATPase